MADNPLLGSAPLPVESQSLDLAAAVSAACDRAESVEPRVRSLLPEPGRRERLLAEAEALASRFPDETDRPPLFGALVGIKDIFNVDGMPTRAGSALPPEEFAGPQAACVSRLADAGALIFGKTVTTEFAYFEPGATTNPHDTRHTPGGSSSGSAAGVAAGIFSLALGSQTVGSVIRPAAFCGVVGFKPSYDRIPTSGTLYFSPAVDHVGAFATSVADMTRAAAVLCDDWSPAAPPSDPVLGVPDGPYLDGTEAEARTAFEAQVAALAADGMQIVRVPAFAEYDEISRRHNDLTAAEYADVHADRFARCGSLFRARSAALFDRGRTIPDAVREAGLAGRAALRDELHTQMDATGIDAWLCPPAPGPAPHGVSSTGNPALNLPWTHAGMPAATVPAGLLNGLPLGLQLAGRFGADEQLLGVATVLEAAIAADAPGLP